MPPIPIPPIPMPAETHVLSAMRVAGRPRLGRPARDRGSAAGVFLHMQRSAIRAAWHRQDFASPPACAWVGAESLAMVSSWPILLDQRACVGMRWAETASRGARTSGGSDGAAERGAERLEGDTYPSPSSWARSCPGARVRIPVPRPPVCGTVRGYSGRWHREAPSQVQGLHRGTYSRHRWIYMQTRSVI